MIPRGVVSVSGAVRGSAGNRATYSTAIGKSDVHKTENIKHFDYCAISERTVPMLVGWLVANRHSPRNLAHAHLPRS
jgi:hypothetical protein